MDAAMAGSTSKCTSDLFLSDRIDHQKLFKSSRCSLVVSFPVDKSSRGFHVMLSTKRASSVVVNCSTTTESPALKLRRILASPGLHQGPACYDALSAKLVEDAGFTFTFMSGFAVAASRLALPDTGLISYGEMVDQGTLITSAVSIPVIGDGDNGYGNALNVKRTVRGYIKAGFAGILLEDQVSFFILS
ncbi:hypothetical protein L7F22_059725 [Adiantum nelumboides]|nr:hypothetical protein [Adiantum nelumboides]